MVQPWGGGDRNRCPTANTVCIKRSPYPIRKVTTPVPVGGRGGWRAPHERRHLVPEAQETERTGVPPGNHGRGPGRGEARDERDVAVEVLRGREAPAPAVDAAGAPSWALPSAPLGGRTDRCATGRNGLRYIPFRCERIQSKQVAKPRCRAHLEGTGWGGGWTIMIQARAREELLAMRLL
jgi:hypothetical protein